jgi:hypothetical protein
MTRNAIEIQGTLRPDGTVVLDRKPELPPGRVRVTVQPLADDPLPETDVISVLRRIHAEQQAEGYVPRSKEEIDADLAAMHDEDEERMRAIERLHEECRLARRQPPPEGA